MKIGVPTEVKNNEFRVGMTPAGVSACVKNGHGVTVQHNAGVRCGFSDTDYINAGANMGKNADDVYAQSEMIVKVKELQPCEYDLLRAQHIIFCYAHLAHDVAKVQAMIHSKCVAIAYEMVTDTMGRLPLLVPMSLIAGRLAVQVGMQYLYTQHGGAGVLLSGSPGVSPAKITVIGTGVVGENAARMALRLGGDVTIVGRNADRLHQLDRHYNGGIKTCYSTIYNIGALVAQSHVVIGAAVTGPGTKAPKLVDKQMVKTMPTGSVLVDVCIDQGGCFATSKPTTHENPVFVVDGVIHYCVPNMPGVVPQTATLALSSATLPFVLEIANKGWQQACIENPNIKNGLNVAQGHITQKAIADSVRMAYTAADTIL